ncbi:DUF3306 domain-containing protein [Polynucleobacter sp. TSB-Sco08W16]|uniref:DUF3306 domain-containing protein n=1 Tax=Polynucleobacter sp. TSB-Sco08W16 TaxID=1758374 RepID=UPI001BFD14C8|nr:DUF3306 domain-containing protein [Polynucleobacter sp. TSB-Sco08W16]QWD73729.1 DUF3306 domain-containing protein [Polynucleobacter sp. TSB-Sco08W16]
MMADSFLSRWSRRKAGKEDELIEQPKSNVEPVKPSEPQESEAPPSATLEDVDKIDRFAPDFSAFMKSDVDPAVQQAALKKMFTDPHFNIMDGLDIYIDDYSKADPLPPGMLERMVQSDMLNLFRKKDEAIAQQDLAPIEPPSAESAKSDLTSTQSLSQDKSANLDEMPIKSDQNKT